MKESNDLDELIEAWNEFLAKTDKWESLIEGVIPKKNSCGLVYELPNFLNRPNEDFAIADMRNIAVALPHYHADGQTEIYFIIKGNGLVVVRDKEIKIKPGDVIIIPPNTSHFSISDNKLVIAAVNTPPWNNEHPLIESNTSVGFNLDQFKRLSKKAQ